MSLWGESVSATAFTAVSSSSSSTASLRSASSVSVTAGAPPSVTPSAAAFRMMAAANPITWQVDVLRFATIGLGSPSTVLLQSALFIVFATVCFVAALRALQSQE